MSLGLQHLLVLSLVGTCGLIIARQFVRTLWMKSGSKFGSCCPKGCDSAKPQAAGTRVVFIPVEMVKASKRSI